jgi:putative ABC transport system substrate-binding protein
LTHFDRLQRREFITLVGGAATWPLITRAQQPAMPVVGFLSSAGPGGYQDFVAGFRRGLNKVGFIEGKNVSIEFPRAEGQSDRLPAPCSRSNELTHQLRGTRLNPK